MAQSQRTSGDERSTNTDFDPIGQLRAALSDLLSTLSSDTSAASEQHGSTRPDGADSGAMTDESSAGKRAVKEGTAEFERDVTVDFAEMKPEKALYALLCREDGKMKQSTIVTETGWSKSKVSRRLGNLEDEEQIGRVRQGREKVVFVKPGAQQTEAEQPEAAA